jgi:hypothetical protein
VLVSGRAAGRILRDVLSSDEQARLLLRTGIAGPGTPSSTGTLYDEAAVHALRLRRTVDERELGRKCPRGLFVARLPRGADLHLARPWQDVADQVHRTVATQRALTRLTIALIGVRVRAWGPLPFVATFLGYVVFAAEVVTLDEQGLRFQSPGQWARVVDQRTFHTPPGGRPGYLWTPCPLPVPDARD